MEKRPQVILVDLDGVLAEFTSWRGLDHFGPALAGAAEFMDDLCHVASQNGIRVLVTRREAEPSVATIHCGFDFLACQLRVWLTENHIMHNDVLVCAAGEKVEVVAEFTRARLRASEEVIAICGDVFKNWKAAIEPKKEAAHAVGTGQGQGRVQGQEPGHGQAVVQPKATEQGKGHGPDAGHVRQQPGGGREGKKETQGPEK